MDMVKGIPDADEHRLFCQTLFNRLMFLYFLQRKGWLKFNGNTEYLEALWQSRRPRENFYEARLRLLFFMALSNPRSANYDLARDVARSEIGDVPFLNGGLFEQKPIDNRQGVVVPNEAIDLILNQLFHRFNFTIEESTPYDVEVAVDPEMLGKVFEELATGRHESGSYYTPRPIVSFMCREGLKGYLSSSLVVERGNATQIGGGGRTSETDVARFVDEHHVDGLSVSDARVLLDALESVTVLDPACGSGAYLLGMLHELVELQRLLYSEKLLADATSLHQLKLRIIQNNLYGADIDPFAVNIAMLRLWLSLAIEFNSTSAPPPLPNLDFKIVRGDSLTAPNPSPSLQPDLFRTAAHAIADEIAALKGEHMRATGDTKRTLADQIEQKQSDLRAVLGSDAAPAGSVDWRILFAEVFDRRGGFDIVLANPPYVRQELIRDQKPRLKDVYGPLYVGTADLYVFFYYRALEVLAPSGMLVFISSNKWLRTAYGAKLRQSLSTRTRIGVLIDFGDLPVFESANAYPLITVAQRGAPQGNVTFMKVLQLGPPYPEIPAMLRAGGVSLSSTALSGSSWSLSESAVGPGLILHGTQSSPLGEYVKGRIFNGVKSGLSEAFVVDRETYRNFLADEPQASSILKPTVDGSDLRRYDVKFNEQYIIYMRWNEDPKRYPVIHRHLAKYREKLLRRNGVRDGGTCPWYALIRPRPESAHYYAQRKILFPDIAKLPRFCLDEIGLFPQNTIYCVVSEERYLLGLLNSSIVTSIVASLSPPVRGGYLRFFRQYVERIPIPLASPADKQPIEALVQKCLDAKGQGPQVPEWEAEIDKRVAWLYGLKSPPGRPEPEDDGA